MSCYVASLHSTSSTGATTPGTLKLLLILKVTTKENRIIKTRGLLLLSFVCLFF